MGLRGQSGRHRRAGRNVVVAALSIALLVTAIVELNGSTSNTADAALPTATIAVAPVADSYVTQARPNAAWGFANQIQASSIPGHGKKAYLRFRLPNLSGETIVRARLVLTRTSHHLGGVIRVRRVANTTWTERGLTWRTAPRVGTILDSVRTNATTQRVALDVPRWSFSGTAVSLAITTPSQTNVAAFRSREADTGRPALRLTVQATSTTTSTRSASTTSTSTTTASTGSACTVSTKLVPSCGYWWGIAPKAHSSTPPATGLAEDEQLAQTRFTMMHTYHVNDQLFPNATERSIALQSGENRLLLINWKPATDMTWAAVAHGSADARIDRLANYIKTSFPYPFFLTIWHEPENDVNPTSGSGMTPSDYAAMFRHVVLRLRADGATKPVIVMTYMGFDNWALKSWFNNLWPGADVVDWIGIDPYGSGASGTYASGDFNTLVNRRITGFSGYYSWATTNHPGKPIMLAEWGVDEGANAIYGKANYLASTSKYLSNYPAIKALAYFDEDLPSDPVAGTAYIDSSTPSLDAFRQLSNWAAAKGPHPIYKSGYVQPAP